VYTPPVKVNRNHVTVKRAFFMVTVRRANLLVLAAIVEPRSSMGKRPSIDTGPEEVVHETSIRLISADYLMPTETLCCAKIC
jgi:hypothetical protein